jgi:hypothetical protein
MSNENKLQLTDLIRLATTSQAVTQACTCAIDSHRGWTRIPPEFPASQMVVAGTLVDDPYVEATFVEYHPHGTDYWSPAAPIALRHYPYNRCSVLQCSACGRCCLTYVEAGGYYVEERIRALLPELIVDVPAPA